uniref:DUF7064 domain-containing protein n=1 Tax=Plectus sambesii TaxID=2011161 RepID=A0A914XFV9_9BILA
MWLYVLYAVAVFVFYFSLKKDPPKLNGVYSQPTKFYWLKFYIFYVLLTLRHRKAKQRKNAEITEEDHKDADLLQGGWGKEGGGGKRSIKLLERMHTLPPDMPKAVDAVYFNAANMDGYYFSVGTAHRPNRIMNAFFILRVPGLGILENIEMPSTNLPVDDVPGAYAAKGITVKCLEPMKKWHISYRGLMHLNKNVNKNPVNADITMIWTNFGDYFDFDMENSVECIARAIATEPWSRAMFKRLQASHQTHYEQFGDIQATIKIDGQKESRVQMRSMRDHTIANHRDWGELRRYIMTIFHLEDGTCIHTSVISMPDAVFSRLELGYIVLPDKSKLAVDRIEVPLPELGEDGQVPKSFSYAFYAGGLRYDVDVMIVDSTKFVMGLENGAVVHENMAEFVCNGVRGSGFTEWEYKNGY